MQSTLWEKSVYAFLLSDWVTVGQQLSETLSSLYPTGSTNKWAATTPLYILFAVNTDSPIQCRLIDYNTFTRPLFGSFSAYALSPPVLQRGFGSSSTRWSAPTGGPVLQVEGDLPQTKTCCIAVLIRGPNLVTVGCSSCTLVYPVFLIEKRYHNWVKMPWNVSQTMLVL